MKKFFPLLLSLCALWMTSVCLARVASPTLTTLSKRADCIVLAQVESISTEPPDTRVAISQVIEVWKEGKGISGKTVKYRASPSFACDMSTTTVGHLAVLFLEHDDTNQYLNISYAGRGQMLINTFDGEPYASLAGVILPEELEASDKLKPHRPGEAILAVNVLKEYVIRSLNNRQ